MTFYCYHCDEKAHQCTCGAMGNYRQSMSIDELQELYDVISDGNSCQAMLRNPNWSPRRMKNKINPEVLSFSA